MQWLSMLPYQQKVQECVATMLVITSLRGTKNKFKKKPRTKKCTGPL